MFETVWAILAIILIDIVLAGDNALVIGMAANKLPEHLRQKAIIWGTGGAIAIRLISIFAMTYILMIPGFKLIGGLLLIYIGWKLAFNEQDHNVDSKDTFWAAIGTIVVADAVMGVDNALGIAAAAQGNFSLIVFGLLISVPIILFGSTIISKILTRYPNLIFIGSYVLFLVALKMIFSEPVIDKFLDPTHDWTETLLPWLAAMVITAKQFYRAKIRN
jgi:YjbE family integral membrane protein